jgi:hypothetical protein
MTSAASSPSAELPAPRRRPLLLAGSFFLLGVVLTGIWFHHEQSSRAAGGLSTPMKNLLGQLAAPVTIRYYSLLPVGSDGKSLPAFAGRVAELLDAVQTASGGKVQITRFDTPAETNANAASADGLQAFNLDKGDACFLGLTIASGKSKESFARLQPEWEPALEYDLARAILRVASAAAPARPAPEIAKPNAAVMASVNRLVPDMNATSVETADQIFHAEFLKACAEAGTEMETQMNAAQQQVVQAQNSGSPADLEAAQKHLSEVQLAQAEKFKQIAARLQLQLAVFQRMKAGATNDAK